MHFEDIELSRHALIRAMQRGISPNFIEATIKGGRINKFGKNFISFSKDCKRFTLICIGQIKGTKIKIITVVKK